MRVIPSLIGTTVEIDEQAKTFIGQPGIGQKLLFVDRSNQLDGFDSNDDLQHAFQFGRARRQFLIVTGLEQLEISGQ